MSDQRNVSTPLELHELNLVNKRQQNANPPLPRRNRNSGSINGNDMHAPPVTPKKNIAPITQVKQEFNDNLNKDPEENSVIYRLAFKKREIIEVENRLKFLKIELHALEVEFQKSQPQISQQSQMTQTQIQIQETFVGLKSRFNETINSISNNMDSDKNNNTSRAPNNRASGGGFFKGIMEKFNEFNISEEDFDTKTKRDDLDKQFYLKQGYEIDDEEIENTAEEETNFLNKLDASTINAAKR